MEQIKQDKGRDHQDREYSPDCWTGHRCSNGLECTDLFRQVRYGVRRLGPHNPQFPIMVEWHLNGPTGGGAGVWLGMGIIDLASIARVTPASPPVAARKAMNVERSACIENVRLEVNQRLAGDL